MDTRLGIIDGQILTLMTFILVGSTKLEFRILIDDKKRILGI